MIPRLELTSEQLAELPITKASKEQLREILCSDDFNPTFFYSEKVELLPDEVGHDRHNRYVLDPSLEGK